MTIDKKRELLDRFCAKHELCEGCPLLVPELRCGRGEYFTLPGEGRMTDESVNLAYSIAFPDSENFKKALEENKKLTEENARLEKDVEWLKAKNKQLMHDNEKLIEEKEKLNNRCVAKIVIEGEQLERIKNECLERIKLDINEIESATVMKVLKEFDRRIHPKLAYQGWYLKETVIPNVIKVVLRGCEDESIT